MCSAAANIGDGVHEEIRYRITTVERQEEILTLFYSNFFSDEPMSKCLDVTEGQTIRLEACTQYVVKGLKDNLSIMAIDPVTDKLLGVCINGPVYLDETKISLEEKLADLRGEKFRHVVRVLHEVNARAPDVFEEFDTDSLFDIKMVVTDKHNRRGGLGTDLLRRSVDLARVLGFKGCKTEATGLFSRTAFERIGFSVRAEYLYSEYEEDGVKVFEAVESPHTCATLLTKKLP